MRHDRLAVCQESNQLVAAKPSIHDLARLTFDPIHLEHALRNIQSIRRSIHLGPSVPQVVSVETPLWHVDAVRSGGSLRPWLVIPKGGRCPYHLHPKADLGRRGGRPKADLALTHRRLHDGAPVVSAEQMPNSIRTRTPRSANCPQIREGAAAGLVGAPARETNVVTSDESDFLSTCSEHGRRA